MMPSPLLDGTTAADGVPNGNHASVEPAFLEQVQVQPHTFREESLSPTDNDGEDDQMEFVDKPRPERMPGELRSVDGDVVLGARCSP